MEAKSKAEMGRRGAFGGGGDGYDHVVLPARRVIGPDANGLKRTIQFMVKDDGTKVRITTTTRVRKLGFARFYKAAVERRNWSKFGGAADDRSIVTVVSHEEVFLALAQSSGTGLLVHATAGDIYITPKTYAAVDIRPKGTVAALRVSNLPKEADAIDIKKLFAPFGPIRSVSVAMHPKTNCCIGFAVVKFFHKADAENAMAYVDGHPYSSLILRVSWVHDRVAS